MPPLSTRGALWISSPPSGLCWACRSSALRFSRSHTQGPRATILSRYASSTALPETLRPSFWYSLIPKFFRRTESKTAQEIKAKEWNPATFYIIIFMLIGSQSIRMIGLRNEYRNFSQKSEAKLGVLKEVIERLKKGEDVDVERLLGTGDATKEREWEEVLREIEEEDSLWHSKRRPNKKSDNPPPSDAAKVSSVSAEIAASISEVPQETKEAPRRPGNGNFY